MLNRAIHELEDQIRASELRVIDSDNRAAASLARLRRGASHAVGTKLAAGAGLLAAGWMLRRPLARRASRRRERTGLLAGVLPGGWLRALPLVLPLLTPLLNRRVTATLASFGLPVGTPRAPAPLRTVPALDLSRYAGTWYEIARLPRRFERRCSADTMAHYSVDDGGLIAVNRCLDEQGRVHESVGRIRAGAARAPGELEVSYAPLWLRWWPGSWDDYCVVYADAEYSCALVGTPERDGLWVLAREPSLPDSALQALLTLAARLGFDTARVRLTPQSGA